MTDPTAAPPEHVENPLVGDQLGRQKARFAPLQVLKGVIVQPRATFTRLRNAERGHWWLILLLNVIAICLLSYATVNAQNTGFQRFALPSGESALRQATPGQGGGSWPQQTVSTSRRTVSTPQAGSVSGQTATSDDSASALSTVLSYAGPVVSGVGGVVLGYLFCSFVVFGMSIVFGGKATYAQVFRMAAWASLPLAIRSFVQAIVSLVTGRTPAPGLSAVMTTQEALDMPLLHTLLGYLDIYLIWSMVLLGVGTAVTSRLSKRKSIAIVIIYLVLAAGVIAGLMLAGDALNDLFGGQFNLGVLFGGPRQR
jgi:hypothetical protein